MSTTTRAGQGKDAAKSTHPLAAHAPREHGEARRRHVRALARGVRVAAGDAPVVLAPDRVERMRTNKIMRSAVVCGMYFAGFKWAFTTNTAPLSTPSAGNNLMRSTSARTRIPYKTRRVL